jgi:RNA polymerase sigma factor (sigma-70 family)
LAPTDQDEWRAALEGNGRAFGHVFERHRYRVRSHLFRLVVPSDIDDALAIVFFEAWRRREQIRFVEESMLPWLITTATNVARNFARSARRYRAALDRLPEPTLHTDAVHDVGDAMSSLRQLPLRDQQVLLLCVIEDYSQSEVATVLGISETAVKSRLARAKKRLADTLRNMPTSSTRPPSEELSYEH